MKERYYGMGVEYCELNTYNAIRKRSFMQLKYEVMRICSSLDFYKF